MYNQFTKLLLCKLKIKNNLLTTDLDLQITIKNTPMLQTEISSWQRGGILAGYLGSSEIILGLRLAINACCHVSICSIKPRART